MSEVREEGVVSIRGECEWHRNVLAQLEGLPEGSALPAARCHLG